VKWSSSCSRVEQDLMETIEVTLGYTRGMRGSKQVRLVNRSGMLGNTLVKMGRLEKSENTSAKKVTSAQEKLENNVGKRG
jgi:hypothetical protein